MQNFFQFQYNRFKTFLRRWFRGITAINNKYVTPRVKVTPWVRFALLGLRIYLLLLVLILIYKFITLIK
jgi:hypothetical protein